MRDAAKIFVNKKTMSSAVAGDEMCLLSHTDRPSSSWLHIAHIALGVYLLYAAIVVSQGHFYTWNSILLMVVGVLMIVVHMRAILHLKPAWRLHAMHISIAIVIIITAWSRATLGRVLGYFLFAIALMMVVYHIRVLQMRDRTARASDIDAPEERIAVREPSSTQSQSLFQAVAPAEPAPPAEPAAAHPAEPAAAPPPEPAAAPPPEPAAPPPPASTVNNPEEDANVESTNRVARLTQSIVARLVQPVREGAPQTPHTLRSRTDHAKRSHHRSRHSSRATPKS